MDSDLKLKKRFLEADVKSFRVGAEIFYLITLDGMDTSDQNMSRREVQGQILPSMLVDPDLMSEELAAEISNGDFSSLNPLGLIHMVGYSSGSADAAENLKNPGELLDEVNDKMPLGLGRWI